MSEFSSGTVVKLQNKDKVLANLTEQEYLIDLQNSWLCKVSVHDMNDNYMEINRNLSNEVPLLHIIHAEDHGFYCCIYYQQKPLFTLAISYELEGNFDMQIGNELYGDDYAERAYIKREKEIFQKVSEEKKRRSHELEAQKKNIFTEIDKDRINQFTLFDIGEEDIQKLQKIITMETYEKDGWGRQLVNEFLDALNLNEFEWISFHYVCKDPEHFNIINRQLKNKLN